MAKRCPNCKSELTDNLKEYGTGSKRPYEERRANFTCEACGWESNTVTAVMRKNFREARRHVVEYLVGMGSISTRSNLNMSHEKCHWSVGFTEMVLKGLEINGIIRISTGLDNRTWIVLVKDLPPEEPRTKMVNISVTTDKDDMAWGFLTPLALTDREIEEFRDLLGEFIDEISEDYESSDVDVSMSSVTEQRLQSHIADVENSHRTFRRLNAYSEVSMQRSGSMRPASVL